MKQRTGPLPVEFSGKTRRNQHQHILRTAQIASIHQATKKVRIMHLMVFEYMLSCAVSIASFCVYSLAVVQFYSKV